MPRSLFAGGEHRAKRRVLGRAGGGGSQRKSTRVAALDGVRAFAVVSVLLYHAGVSGVKGGLLGVDVFFVLSGFLITKLLVGELERSGTVRVRDFWARRARRLLPALFVLLLGVALYAKIFAGQIDVPSVRADALSALLYVANWHFLLAHQGYFHQSAAPSPLLHLWSLGVEEQYYLVWPLTALFVFRRWRARGVAWFAGLGAVMSGVLMGSMAAAGFGSNRLYFGTDTRAQALLIGSFLGAVASADWRVLQGGWTETRLARRLGLLTGLLGCAALVLAWHGLDGQSQIAYRGGFFAVAVATGAIIVAVATWPASALARVLALRPIAYVGRISYGLYLYHWPIFLALDHARTGLSGSALLAARLAATFGAAAASFACIEQPIRRRAFFARWRGLVLTGFTGAGVAGAVLVATAVPVAASYQARTATTSAALSSAERTQLVAARAFTSDPVRLLLAGDSQALTLGIGLQVASQRQFGVSVVNGGVLGCDLDPGTQMRFQGQVQPVSDSCRSWQTIWPRNATRLGTPVVALFVGRWELYDHFYEGRWTHVGEPLWDTHLQDTLSQAVKLIAATGAKVVLLTSPYVDPAVESSDGTPYPENLPVRTDRYNAILKSVAAADPRAAAVIDVNRLLDPHGVYARVVDNVAVRTSDGIHITRAGGEWLQARMLPEVAQLGLAARAAAARAVRSTGSSAAQIAASGDAKATAPSVLRRN